MLCSHIVQLGLSHQRLFKISLSQIDFKITYNMTCFLKEYILYVEKWAEEWHVCGFKFVFLPQKKKSKHVF